MKMDESSYETLLWALIVGLFGVTCMIIAEGYL